MGETYRVADFIADFIEKIGVKNVFLLPGGGAMHLVDAVGKNSKIEVLILDGQESFKIKSFINSNIWALLPSGKSKFKKGDIVDCFFQDQPNKNF